MKNTIIKISVITSLALITLNASTIEPITNWSKYPIPQEVVSKSKGGQLSDKVAMKDGVGSVLVKGINGNSITLNNEQYNQLLLLNKDKLTDTIGLKELIASGDIIVDASTLNSINGNGLSNPTGLPVDGTLCDDKNSLTINDIYTNNICLGTSIVGTSCDDNNVNTNDDKYDVNGLCVGIPINLVFKATSTNLVNEATFSYHKNASYFGQTGAGLFNKNLIGDHRDNTGFYWGYYAPAIIDNFEISVQEPFRIWRYSSSGYEDAGYNSKFKILQLKNGSWIDVSSKHLPVVSAYNRFVLFTEELEAGSYRFVAIPGLYKIDTEWFIEKKVPN